MAEDDLEAEHRGGLRDAGNDRDDESKGLTPETVAYKTFSSARRGVSQNEVRAFLQDVAAEMAAAVGRERQLLAKVHELEERLAHLAAHPPTPTEEQLLEHLGDETARVLRSAQEAADEIRASAIKRAHAIVAQGEDEAARLREAATKVLDERSREADIAATVTTREAEGHAQARLREVAREAEAEIDAARQRGREMVGEARAVRERILADLGKRRSAVQGEIVQLEAARAQILESGRLVRERLAQAAAAFTPFEPEAPEEVPEEELVPDAAEAGRPDEDVGKEAEPAAEAEDRHEVGAHDSFPVLELVETPEELAGAVEEQDVEIEEPDEEAEEKGEEEATDATAAEDEPEPEIPDFVAQGPEPDLPEFVEPKAAPVTERASVDEIFARIRSGGREEPVADAPVALATEPAPEPEASTQEVEIELEPEPEPEPASESEPEVEPPVRGDAALLARRDEMLAPVNHELLRRAKRTLQDEQNELLDRIRRERGRAGADQLLAPLSALVTDWADVLEPAVNEAYRAGRAAQAGAEPTGAAAPRRLVSGLAEVLVTSFREQLVLILDAAPGEPGPEREAELSSRVGARYREWRAQELESRVGDLLAAAYAKGVYDAAPEGSQLRWIPAKVGECPDADDNALEPTTRGTSFPTGQPFPPAHAGCRCLLTVSDAD